MKPGPNVTEDVYTRQARWLKAMAHPERLRILDALRQEEACVCHLEALLNRPQPYVSQQLRVLRQAGIVRTRRVGTNVFYFIADPKARRVLDEVLGPEEQLSAPTRFPSCRCPKCQGTDTPLLDLRLSV